MVKYTVLISSVITFGMVLLQLSLTAGAPLGEFALGGAHKVLPKEMRTISAIFCIIFLLTGLSYLQFGGYIQLFPNIIAKIMIIINTLFTGYGIYGNLMLTNSKKEMYIMTPLCVITFICGLIIITSMLKKN